MPCMDNLAACLMANSKTERERDNNNTYISHYPLSMEFLDDTLFSLGFFIFVVVEFK